MRSKLLGAEQRRHHNAWVLWFQGLLLSEGNTSASGQFGTTAGGQSRQLTNAFVPTGPLRDHGFLESRCCSQRNGRPRRDEVREVEDSDKVPAPRVPRSLGGLRYEVGETHPSRLSAAFLSRDGIPKQACDTCSREKRLHAAESLNLCLVVSRWTTD